MNQTKKTINIVILLSLLILSGCGKVIEVNNEVDKEEIGKTEEQNNNIATSSEQANIDTSDWLTYRNENIGIEFIYPRGWNFEDRTQDYKHLHINFILADKNDEKNYIKSFSVSAIKNEKYDNIIDYYENATDLKFNKFVISEKRRFIKTKNNYEAILEYDEPAFALVDAAKLLCNDYVVLIDSVYGRARTEIESLVNEFVCF